MLSGPAFGLLETSWSFLGGEENYKGLGIDRWLYVCVVSPLNMAKMGLWLGPIMMVFQAAPNARSGNVGSFIAENGLRVNTLTKSIKKLIAKWIGESIRIDTGLVDDLMAFFKTKVGGKYINFILMQFDTSFGILMTLNTAEHAAVKALGFLNRSLGLGMTEDEIIGLAGHISFFALLITPHAGLTMKEQLYLKGIERLEARINELKGKDTRDEAKIDGMLRLLAKYRSKIKDSDCSDAVKRQADAVLYGYAPKERMADALDGQIDENAKIEITREIKVTVKELREFYGIGNLKGLIAPIRLMHLFEKFSKAGDIKYMQRLEGIRAELKLTKAQRFILLLSNLCIRIDTILTHLSYGRIKNAKREISDIYQ